MTISAPADAGVFYGTRTLKQAVHDGGTAPEGVVRDEPAKERRGFMLDIARKHYDAEWIKDRIRELGDLKFNELGLHFSDDQGFRIESDSHPEVVSADHLTKAQVKEIVDLAAERHIEVVPEIDSPGHLGAVIAAHPDLQLRNAQGTPTRGAIDISKAESAEIVDDLLNEYADVFPGSQWHLGGDEYQALTVSDPQASYPQLAAAARERYGPGATVADLTTGWLDDRARTVRAHDRTPRAWNDGFFRDTSVRPAAGLQVAYWTGKEIGARQPVEYLAAGREVINYNDEFLYYVLGEPQTFVYPTGERIYEQWTRACCAAPSRSRPSTTTRSSAAASRCGATSPTPRPRPRSRTASGCPSRRPSRSCGTRAARAVLGLLPGPGGPPDLSGGAAHRRHGLSDTAADRRTAVVMCGRVEHTPGGAGTWATGVLRRGPRAAAARGTGRAGGRRGHDAAHLRAGRMAGVGVPGRRRRRRQHAGPGRRDRSPGAVRLRHGQRLRRPGGGGPESGAWTTCLVRAAMAGYLGAENEGLTLEDYFLDPRDAADRAVAWAAEAGRDANPRELVDLLTAEPGPQAENLFFRFLDRLGVVPL